MHIFRITSAVALSLTLCSGYGQVDRFVLGIEGGPSVISMRGNKAAEQFGSDMGYAAGVAFQYNFTDRWALRTGCALERKGAGGKVLFTDINGSTIADTRAHEEYDYLTVPLLARYSFGTRLRPYVNAGPFIGYLMKVTERIDASGTLPGYAYDHTELNNSIDLGLTAGVGIVIPAGERVRLSAEIRNNLGLYNVSAVPVIDDGLIKTNSTALLIGCAYAFNKRQ